jgi:hypothetical protein
MRQHGVAVYWSGDPNDDDEAVRTAAEQVLDRVVALGANSVSVTYPFFMASATADTVLADDPRTPSPERLGIFLDEANRRALRTTVRPMLDEGNLTGERPGLWRGNIAPADRDGWFGSYAELLQPYAQLAAEKDVTTFVVGVELSSLERDSRWQWVIDAVRSEFDGELGYSTNHDRLGAPALADEIHQSVDAYPALALGDDAAVAQLVVGLNQWLTTAAGGGVTELVLAEVGIGAHAGAYRQPWSPAGVGLAIVPEIQQRWFDAMCELMRTRNLAGIYYSSIGLDEDLSGGAPDDDHPMNFMGRPGEQSITACFAQSADRLTP